MNVQDCDEQNSLPDVVYGELSSIVPPQEFHAPLSTPPLLAEMRTVTVFLTLADPHVVMGAVVEPTYALPVLVNFTVNGAALKPGGPKSPSVVSVHRLAMQLGLKVHESVHVSPTFRLAPLPGVLTVLYRKDTLPWRGADSVVTARTGERRDWWSPHIAATWYW